MGHKLDEGVVAYRGDVIRHARRKLLLNQQELGRRLATAIGRHLSFSQARISYVEQNKCPLGLFELKKLAEILDLSEEQITGGVPVAIEKRDVRRQVKDSFGTSDMVALKGVKAGLELHFTAGGIYDRSVLLTKFPIALAGAIESALRQKGLFEYACENFRGRVCSEGPKPLPFAWVAEFLVPKPAGFLIHMSREGFVLLKSELLKLSLHDLLTD